MEVKEIYELEYKVNKNKDYIKLLDNEFINRNRLFGYYIYNKKRYKLDNKIETKIIFKDKIKIILVFLKKIFNKTNMFKNCQELLSFSTPNYNEKKYSNDTQNNIINEEESFLYDYIYEKGNLNESFAKIFENSDFSNDCTDSEISEKKETYSDKSTLNNINENLANIQVNYTNLYGMFYNCSSLLSVNGIKDFDKERISNIGVIFYGCASLNSIPDISKWNTNNAINFSCIFYGCSSLISLPDISNWNTNNVNDFSGIFYGCKSLISLPDISKWNINNAINVSKIFCDYKSLASLPDISKWNTYNITDFTGMLSHCSSLISLPDISKWNTNNLIAYSQIYDGCLSLIIP